MQDRARGAGGQGAEAWVSEAVKVKVTLDGATGHTIVYDVYTDYPQFPRDEVSRVLNTGVWDGEVLYPPHRIHKIQILKDEPRRDG